MARGWMTGPSCGPSSRPSGPYTSPTCTHSTTLPSQSPSCPHTSSPSDTSPQSRPHTKLSPASVCCHTTPLRSPLCSSSLTSSPPAPPCSTQSKSHHRPLQCFKTKSNKKLKPKSPQFDNFNTYSSVNRNFLGYDSDSDGQSNFNEDKARLACCRSCSRVSRTSNLSETCASDDHLANTRTLPSYSSETCWRQCNVSKSAYSYVPFPTSVMSGRSRLTTWALLPALLLCVVFSAMPPTVSADQGKIIFTFCTM